MILISRANRRVTRSTKSHLFLADRLPLQERTFEGWWYAMSLETQDTLRRGAYRERGVVLTNSRTALGCAP